MGDSYLDLVLHDFFDFISNNHEGESEFDLNYSEIEVYNYLEKITGGFDSEKTELVLVDVYINYCLYDAEYKFDENTSALVKFAVKLLRKKYRSKTQRTGFDEYEKKIYEIP
jgi:hypothetical protein